MACGSAATGEGSALPVQSAIGTDSEKVIAVDFMCAGFALAAVAVGLLLRCVRAWRYTGQFVDSPREPPASHAVVAARPYNPDQVVHEVGRWEYLKERLELGRGPTALCGCPLWIDAGSSIEDPPADVPRCPDCADDRELAGRPLTENQMEVGDG